MKTSIKYRLFIAMLLATGTVVVCMFFIMKWSFHRGFLNYVNSLEEQHLIRLKADLEKNLPAIRKLGSPSRQPPGVGTGSGRFPAG